MKERGIVSDSRVTEMLFALAIQSPLIDQAEQRQRKILDADYSPVDIHEYVNDLKGLDQDVKEKLKDVLRQTPNAFKGGLGTLRVQSTIRNPMP